MGLSLTKIVEAFIAGLMVATVTMVVIPQARSVLIDVTSVDDPMALIMSPFQDNHFKYQGGGYAFGSLGAAYDYRGLNYSQATARNTERPGPDMDRLCGVIENSPYSYLPGQTTPWVQGVNDAEVVVSRIVRAKDASSTWSCEPGGDPIDTRTFSRFCALTYNDDRYVIASYDVDDAYALVCLKVR